MCLRTILCCLLSLAIVGPAIGDTPLDGYKNPDAGRLILSVAVDGFIPTDAVIHFRTIGGDEHGSVRSPGGKWLSKADASADQFDLQTQTAIQRLGLEVTYTKNDLSVHVIDLPPGDYEIYEMDVDGNRSGFRWRQKLPIGPLGFHISSSRTTYFGRFSVVAVTRAMGLFHVHDLHHWTWIFTEQAQSDLPIATLHHGDLGPVDATAVIAMSVPEPAAAQSAIVP